MNNSPLMEIVKRVGNIKDISSVIKRPKNGRCIAVTFVNPNSVYIANNNSHYLPALSRMDYLLPDGILMALFAKWARKVDDLQRQSFDGNSLAPLVFDICKREKIPVYFVGGKDDIATKAARIYEEQFNITVAGYRNGYFTDSREMDDFCRSIAAFQGILIVGMGSPHQEAFMAKIKEYGWAGTAFSCGGYFDQTVERGSEYYPAWINRLNLRFADRLMKEPKRLGRRYFLEYLPFFKQALLTVLSGKRL